MEILDTYPEYAATSRLDDLRQSEYGYLDEQDHVYLDYTGAGLSARAQHEAHAKRHATTVLGNPHSASPTSEAATALVEQARQRVLKHFNAPSKEYAVVFTANASGAARLIGESYRFHKNNRLVLTSDNHNSLHGIREYARRAGASTTYIPSTQPELTVDPAKVEAALPQKEKKSKWGGFWGWFGCGCNPSDYEDEYNYTHKPDQIECGNEHAHDRGLFAYPAQSNFSGVRHPLEWVSMAQSRGYDVLLDAAAYLPTSRLDLSEVHPEFVLVSWYKLFGYPTGVGCLVARREALSRLDRPWFSGGTIRAVSVRLDWHAPARALEAQFEDGTVNFQAIPDVATGLDWLEEVGWDHLQTRVRCLTSFFLRRLCDLRHSNGRPMVVVYGPAAGSKSARGATVTFNFVDPHGRVVDERNISQDAASARISLRTGCFCNPGAGETALGLSDDELRLLQYLAANNLSDDALSSSGSSSNSFVEKPSPSKPILIAGAVRVSFGVASNVADVDRFFAFATQYRDKVADNSHLSPRSEC